jgi:hypothetical protein
MNVAKSPSTNPTELPPASSSIREALTRFTTAEASGESRIANATLQGRIRRRRMGSNGASYLWIDDGTGEIEVIVRSRLRGIVPNGLRERQNLEVLGTLKRHRGSAPQIDACSLRILPDHLVAEISSPPVSSPVETAHPKRHPLSDHFRTLGVVSSLGSAALDDVLHVARAHAPWVRIVVCPAILQGPGAAESMIQGILRLHLEPGIDAILLTRGGATVPGDLAPYADEMLVKTLRLARLPVITAIGHARDATLADQAAAASYATPSLAAVSLLPDRVAIGRELDALAERIQRRLADSSLGEELRYLPSCTPALPSSIGGTSPAALLAAARQRLNQIERRLDECTLDTLAAPALWYTLLCDLCLARAILEMRPHPLAVLEEPVFASNKSLTNSEGENGGRHQRN